MSTENSSIIAQSPETIDSANPDKKRYYEPAPQDIDVDNFRKVIESRRSVRKFTKKPIPEDVLDACLDLALLAPNSSNPAKKKRLVKAYMSQLAAKTASELIICVARTDRIDEMAKRNVNEFPYPEAPAAIKKYYKYIPYNYKTGYLNVFGNFKKVAFKVARTLDKQMPVSAFSPSDAKLWATKTTALACENLVLALRAYGFDSCMMEGFDEPMVRDILGLNDQQYPVMVIGAGERAKDGVFFPQYRFDRELFIQKV